MMLATRCPYCRTTFRVVQDQLKICNGIVRCGACRQVFNGIEQLQSADAVVRGESEWPDAAQVDLNPVTIVAEEPQNDFTEAHDDLNLDLTPAEEAFEHTSPLAATPDPVFTDEEPVADAAFEPEVEEPQPDLVLHVDDRKEPKLTEAFEPETRDVDGENTLDSMHLLSAPSAGTYQPPIEDEEPAYTVEIRSQAEEPAFMQRARRQERFGRMARMTTIVLILLLLPVLSLQAIDVFHQRIGAMFPVAKPLLAQVCEVIGCQTELAAQIDAVSVDSSELHAPTNGDKAFALTLLLRNRSPLAQAWPYIEMTLNDANEKPVARRVFNASEYLDDTQDEAKGIGANSEHSLKLVFEAEQSLKPVGYRVYLFYP